MPQSLHRTWVALAVATLAVLVVALLTGRDLVRDVNAPCPGSLHEEPFASWTSLAKLEPVYMESLSSESTPSCMASPRLRVRLGSAARWSAGRRVQCRTCCSTRRRCAWTMPITQ